MKLLKTPGWEDRLTEAVKQYRGETFDRAARDCIRFVGDAILAMTEHDLALPYRNAYATDEEALELAQSFEGGLVGEITRVFEVAGFVPLPTWKQVSRGDLSVIRSAITENAGCLAVCTGPVLMTMGRRGPFTLSLDKSELAWRIPKWE